jgi:hypothetical protein
MTESINFENILILGNGYSAHLAAIALAPVLPITAMVAPKKGEARVGPPEGLVGQHAHSHIFLPRLERELHHIDPDLLPRMAEHGFRFVPGSYRLGDDAPPRCRRLFATRWQFDHLIETLYQERALSPHVDGLISGIETQAGGISAVLLSSGEQISVPRSTLVVDAAGTRSPVMKELAATSDEIIDQPGNVVYITQFFRLREPEAQSLPDPLIDCPHDFGAVAAMLYPGVDGWFSVSLAIDAQQKALIRELRDRDALASFCRHSPYLAVWIDNARAEGPNRIYINPRNTWNVGVFESGTAPVNYLAVGDALTTMLPTLGANCSFAATHVRIIRDLLVKGEPGIQQAFSQAVKDEQFMFFEKALKTRPQVDKIIPYTQSPQRRPVKRLKRSLRRLLGLDRRRIVKQLSDSSSL